MEKTTFADLSSLKQLGVGFKYLFVPSVVLNSVYSIAVLATKSPMYYNWAMPRRKKRITVPCGPFSRLSYYFLV